MIVKIILHYQLIADKSPVDLCTFSNLRFSQNMKYNTKVSVIKCLDVGKHLCSHTLPLLVLSQHELVKGKLCRGLLTNITFLMDQSLITQRGVGYKMGGGKFNFYPYKKGWGRKRF